MKRRFLGIIVLLVWPLLFTQTALSAEAVAATAGDGNDRNWEKEFQAICSRTDDAMMLSISELKDFISRCDGLKERIGALPEPSRKIHLRRLHMCRDLFVFTLDTRSKE
jgi:hypothetical protein